MENMQDKRIKIFCYLLFCFVIFQYLYSLGALSINASFGDFRTTYAQSGLIEKIRHNTSYEDVYTTLLMERVLLYPPVFYMAFFRIVKLFSGIPFCYQAVCWLIFNQLLLLGAVAFIFKAIRPREKLSLEDIAISVFISLNFLPVAFNNEDGNFNIVILFLLCASFLSFQRKNKVLSGFLIALTASLKWVTAILFLLFLIKREYRVILAGLISLAALFLLSLVYYGVFLHLVFIKILFTFSSGASTWFINHSMLAFWSRLFTDSGITSGILNMPALGHVLSLICAIVLVILSCAAVRKAGPEGDSSFALEFSLFVTLSILISPYVHIHHLAWLLFPFLAVFLSRGKYERLYILFIAAYILTGLTYWPDGLSVFHSGLGVIFLSGRFYGTLLLWIGLIFLLKRQSGVVKPSSL
jgi:hypothetical protein